MTCKGLLPTCAGEATLESTSASVLHGDVVPVIRPDPLEALLHLHHPQLLRECRKRHALVDEATFQLAEQSLTSSCIPVLKASTLTSAGRCADYARTASLDTDNPNDCQALALCPYCLMSCNGICASHWMRAFNPCISEGWILTHSSHDRHTVFLMKQRKGSCTSGKVSLMEEPGVRRPS